MPNRLVRDGILSSEKVASLKWDEEVFYRRLFSIVDDYGRTEANHQYLRARCYPLQTDAVTVADIARWMEATAKVELIRRYEAGGKQFLEITKFGQQIRSKSKCPAPGEQAPPVASEDASNLFTLAQPGALDPTDGALVILQYLNAKARRNFRYTPENLKLIRLRLADVGGDVPGVKKMIDRQCECWGGTDMAEFLCPTTLFRKSHKNGGDQFGKYYDTRSEPVPPVRGVPLHVQIKTIEESIAVHLCNPASRFYDSAADQSKQSEYAAMKKKLAELKQRMCVA